MRDHLEDGIVNCQSRALAGMFGVIHNQILETLIDTNARQKKGSPACSAARRSCTGTQARVWSAQHFLLCLVGIDFKADCMNCDM